MQENGVCTIVHVSPKSEHAQLPDGRLCVSHCCMLFDRVNKLREVATAMDYVSAGKQLLSVMSQQATIATRQSTTVGAVCMAT